MLKRNCYGSPNSNKTGVDLQETEEGGVLTWKHFYLELPRSCVSNNRSAIYIVKHVIPVKLAEQKEAKDAKEKKQIKQEMMEAIREKKPTELKETRLEDLQKRIADL